VLQFSLSKNSPMVRKYDTRSIRGRRSYALDDIAKLLGTHKRTCSRWLVEGLPVLKKNTSPLLIMGYELKKFLRSNSRKGKIKLKENEIYCLRCRVARKAVWGTEKIVETGKLIGKENRKQLKKIGICEHCGKEMHKFC
jgi:hypothetical protein